MSNQRILGATVESHGVNMNKKMSNGSQTTEVKKGGSPNLVAI